MASIDIDEYLKQEEPTFAQDPSHEMDMSGFKQNIFETNGFGMFGSYGNNLSMDPFRDNNGNGGHGSLSFYGNMTHQLPVAPSGFDSHSLSHSFEHAHKNPGSALSGLNGHYTSQNLQQYFEEHQPANLLNHNDHIPGLDAEQYQDSSVMPNDGEVGEIADSTEHGQDSREQDDEEDKVPLKNEDYGSDDEFKEEDGEDEAAEEDEDDEEGDGGQKKRKLKDKRKPYKQPRILTRWDRRSNCLCCGSW